VSRFIAFCQRCYSLGVINMVPPDRGELWHLPLVVSGGVCPDDEVFVTRSLNVTPKTPEQLIIARSGKSEAKVTNKRRLRSRCCTAGANYWQTRSISLPLCNSTATCCNLGRIWQNCSGCHQVAALCSGAWRGLLCCAVTTSGVCDLADDAHVPFINLLVLVLWGE